MYKPFVFFVRSRGNPEIAGLAVNLTDPFQEYLLIKGGGENLFGALPGHGGVNEHIVAMRRKRIEARIL